LSLYKEEALKYRVYQGVMRMSREEAIFRLILAIFLALVSTPFVYWEVVKFSRQGKVKRKRGDLSKYLTLVQRYGGDLNFYAALDERPRPIFGEDIGIIDANESKRKYDGERPMPDKGRAIK
jgi:hypothetical protein